MSKHQKHEHQNNPDYQLDGILERYVFDSASGLYKHRCAASGNKAQDSSQGNQSKKWFQAEVRTDWTILLLSIATLVVITIYTYANWQLWTETRLSRERVEQEIAVAQLQAVAANHAADTASRGLDEVGKQTTAQQQQVGIMRKQLEAADRPWVTVEIGVDDGLRSTKQGMVLYGVHHTLRNVGRSTATDVFFGMRVIALPAMELDRNWRSPIDDQAVFCRDIVQAKKNIGGEVLFPDTPITIGGANVGLSPKLFSRSDYPQIPQEILTEFRVIIFGCVDYQYATSERHHQTGFVYHMRAKNPLNNWPPFVMGVDVSADKLEILPYWLGGSYAN